MNRLKFIRKKHSGRDASGQVSVRHQGAEQKRFMRIIDFARNKFGIEGRVASIEYDPNRTTQIALIHYADGDKMYILSPLGLKIGDVVKSGSDAEVKTGNALPLQALPLGTVVHNVELMPGRGGQLARGAGTSVIIQAKEGNDIDLKLPSGEIRRVDGQCLATVGTLGNIDWKNEVIGKAGRSRHMGIRPKVRGTAQNPRSHPHGGGEGRSGIGRKRPMTYAGRPAVGKTRKKKKYSDKYILQRRKK
ncbi:MAG: 50S ribosomal protein L2 [Candidatus Levybacteria bacterium]|nr:50S ribosomal protein L2 [Candidatus Levybacteria bacterium]